MADETLHSLTGAVRETPFLATDAAGTVYYSAAYLADPCAGSSAL